MASTYRLRICSRDEDGTRTIPTLDIAFPENDDASAIETARSHPLEFFLEAGDTAWPKLNSRSRNDTASV